MPKPAPVAVLLVVVLLLLTLEFSDAFGLSSIVRYPIHNRFNHSLGDNNCHHSKPKTLKTTILAAQPIPIDGSQWPDKFPAKEHCSRCGLCETTLVSKVTEACAFIAEGMARIDDLEGSVHGRGRDLDSMYWSSNDEKENDGTFADEGRFGVLQQPITLARGKGIVGAQWTGCVTAIALSALESGMVDAVVCIAKADSGGWSDPEPIIAKTSADVLRGRGVKPALAPSLKVLDEIRSDGDIRKLLFCGVGCAVQAFRSVQDDLGLDKVYVLGTNCADNSPTPQAARNFIEDGLNVDSAKVRGYEFMQDFRVHVKVKGNDNDSSAYVRKPYFCLPGTVAEEAIAPSCLACFDYTNALADVVVGYMGAPLDGRKMDQAFQTITVRNSQGEELLMAALQANRIELSENAMGSGKHEQMAAATVASDSIILAMTGGEVKESGMPGFVGEIMAAVMRSVGPKGVGFARYSIDYHILRNYLHVLDVWGERRADIALPAYAKQIVDEYLKNDESFASLRNKVLTNKQPNR